jgi:hypothetical protein
MSHFHLVALLIRFHDFSENLPRNPPPWFRKAMAISPFATSVVWGRPEAVSIGLGFRLRHRSGTVRRSGGQANIMTWTQLRRRILFFWSFIRESKRGIVAKLAPFPHV